MKHTIYLILTLLVMVSCTQDEPVDLILKNGVIYSVNDDFENFEALAVKEGRIVELGTSNEILKKYYAHNTIDLEGKFVYPGFIDAHCHFYGYGLFLKTLQLRGTTSFDEIIIKLVEFEKSTNSEWLVGRGWDQNSWEVKKFPSKKRLDELYPDRPVILYRIDGHAVLVNTEAFKRSEIDSGKFKEYMHFENGEFTGILFDNAADIAKDAIPDPTNEEIEEALLKAQQNCFEVGLTTISDAGLNRNVIESIRKLNNEGSLKMRIYAMLNPNQENVQFIEKNGIFKTDHLNIRSLKLYADGALGSRGACMIRPYDDDNLNSGFILENQSYFEKYCKIAEAHNYQVCIHAIGDSANRYCLNLYSKFLEEGNDKRWRIEHAQVVHPNDFDLFGKYNIVPSVQPTHATSDMYWAKNRIGDRVRYAYAYKALMNQNGWIPSGSDFPVESINPIFGFYSAAIRKDHNGSPKEGFQIGNALSREEALKAMTIWAAKSNFEEKEKGSLEIGKLADFVILDKDIMETEEDKIVTAKVLSTYLAGKKVYSN